MVQIQQIKLAQREIINLSPAWTNLIHFVQLHPFVSFEKLSFRNGDPDLGAIEMKIEETVKF